MAATAELVIHIDNDMPTVMNANINLVGKGKQSQWSRDNSVRLGL